MRSAGHGRPRHLGQRKDGSATGWVRRAALYWATDRDRPALGVAARSIGAFSLSERLPIELLLIELLLIGRPPLGLLLIGMLPLIGADLDRFLTGTAGLASVPPDGSAGSVRRIRSAERQPLPKQ